MKIVHIIARFNQGGTASWIKLLSLGLKAEGHEVQLLSGSVQGNEVEDSGFFALSGIRVSGLGRSISLVGDFKAFFQIRKFLIHAKVDIVNTHTFKAGVLGRLAALSIRKNRPVIIHTFHGHLLYGYFGKLSTLIFTSIEKFLASKSNLLLVSGERVKNELLANGIGAKNNLLVVRPGVSKLEKINRVDCRKKFGIPLDVHVVGWLGRMVPIKRPDKVIYMANNMPETIFLMGGDGELFEKINQSAPKNVLLVGWSSASEIWSCSNIALLTSDNEAQPISLIESAYLGLPSVAQDVGSVSEVVLNGKTGFLFTDIELGIVALRKLMRDEVAAASMGSAALDYVTHKFSPEQFIQSHIEAYRLAISQKASS